MKIRMLTSMAGRDADGEMYVRDEATEHDVDDAEALRLIESEQAEAVGVKPSKRRERAVASGERETR